MDQSLNGRFETVARAKLAALTEVYDRLLAEPAESGDKALYQRQSAGKAVLTHIALLRKLLGVAGPAASAARPDALDINGYRAMVAELQVDEGDDG